MEQIVNALDWFNVDRKAYDYTEFADISNFKWKYGITPFSHFQIPVFMSLFYLATLFTLQVWMKNKKPFVLKSFTFVHNVILTVLSLAMFVGTTYGAILKYRAQGFWAGLVCEQEAEPIRGPLYYWSYIFYLSKFYELIDSYLLVLKKKPLIFLHVFHHFVMPYVCWAGLEGKWCMALWTSSFWNSFVHIIMYYYYSVSTLGYSPWWKKYLTGLQIYQFVSGVLYTWVFFFYYFQDIKITNEYPFVTFRPGCTGELWAVVGMFAVNCSFLVLFSQFYVQSYRTPRGQNAQRTKKE
eukprot:TRINITY_DN653_c0_g1_i1.p1 TRINITY_DN653_c0_g1~~TRINITY_DN653_c0_g1_i1.p1  ORF type:complete len:295 (+),score=60.71 TRINITY_DN653_c0_g1_i1:151-1035(+)